MNLDEAIKTQHSHFRIAYDGLPRFLDAEEENFRIACMLEEITEFVVAKTLEDKYDALLDLIVFAAGTAERMGLPLAPGLEEVFRSNMEKTLGPLKKRGGFSLDLSKPKDWKAPALDKIIAELQDPALPGLN